MNVVLVAVCALVTWSSAGAVRNKRFLPKLQSTVGVSSGYGGAYAAYGDFSRYADSFPSDYAPAYPPGYSSYGSYAVTTSESDNDMANMAEAVNIAKVKEERKVAKLRKVVKVRKLSLVPKVVKVKKVKKVGVAPRSSAGYIGYGSGVGSGYSSIPGYSTSNRSSYPGYASGYATGLWLVHM